MKRKNLIILRVFMTSSQLVISSDSLVEIDEMCVSEAGGDAPREICGFLVGQIKENQYFVHFGLGVQNSAERDQHHRYQISTEAFVEAERLLQMQKLHIIGIFHSHPNGQALPSQLDIDYFFPGWIYLIIGVSAHGVNDRRAFQLSGFGEGGIVEVGITMNDNDIS